MNIHCGLMCQNEFDDLVTNVERLLPHVETINIIDGGSLDKTIVYMRNWAQQEPKIRFFIHPWGDNFPAQRNEYLKRIAEVARQGDWCVTCDPDEVFDEEACTKFKELAQLTEGLGGNMVGFKCRSVELRGKERAWVNEDNYWKRLMFKWEAGLQYLHAGDGPVHEFLVNTRNPSKRVILDTGVSKACPTPYFYEHRKQGGIVALHGMRNLFIGGGGPNMGRQNPRWIELRAICSSLGLQTWHQFYAYLLKGNIDSQIKRWMIQWKNINEADGDSEHRECYLSYFRILHPEEEPQELRNTHVP